MKVSPYGDDLYDPCAYAHSFIILYSFFFILYYFSGGADRFCNNKYFFTAAALSSGRTLFADVQISLKDASTV